MCPKKLSESDKQEILELYRNSPETTSTLALRYEVSSSTISRLLKKSLSDQEYEDLIQEKRLGRTQKPIEQLVLSLPDSEAQAQADQLMESELLSEQEIADRILAYSSILDQDLDLDQNLDQININETLINQKVSPLEDSLDQQSYEKKIETDFQNQEQINDFEEENNEDFDNNSNVMRRRKRRSSSVVSQAFAEEILAENNLKISQSQAIEINQNQLIESMEARDLDEDDLEDDSTMSHETVLALQEFLGEELEDPNDQLDDEEDEQDDLDDEEIEPVKMSSRINVNAFKQGTLSIFPVEKASFPRTCYIVVDRASELITRPLQDFRELGLIPPEEFAQKTLPIFENHRVARRFSKRKERVIKIPDGRILKKTCSYLASKGITRLILDGQVYSLS